MCRGGSGVGSVQSAGDIYWSASNKTSIICPSRLRIIPTSMLVMAGYGSVCIVPISSLENEHFDHHSPCRTTPKPVGNLTLYGKNLLIYASEIRVLHRSSQCRGIWDGMVRMLIVTRRLDTGLYIQCFLAKIQRLYLTTIALCHQVHVIIPCNKGSSSLCGRCKVFVPR